MKTLILVFTGLNLILVSTTYGQDEFPAWVPEDAVKAARFQWDYMVETHSIESITHMFGLKDKDEASRCILKNPYKIIKVDYETYKAGDDIQNYFNSLDGELDEAYKFVVYLDDRYIGTIGVIYKDGDWRFFGSSGHGQNYHQDLFAPIYSKYRMSSEYVVYRSLNRRAFFVIKDNAIVETFEWKIPGHRFLGVDPEKHMLEEKARIEERKNSSQQSHSEEYKFPEWVPKEAVEAVKKIWEHKVSIYSENSLRNQFGFYSKEEALSCEFKNPVRLTFADYSSYKEGDNILSHIKLLDGYSFIIYQGNINKGDISIEYVEGDWAFIGMGGSGGKPTEDRVGNIYKQYPLSSGYKIYGYPDAYFVVKGDSVIEVNKLDYSTKEFRGFDPVEHMITKRERIKKFKEHPDYERFMKQMEEREKETKQMILKWKKKHNKDKGSKKQ